MGDSGKAIGMYFPLQMIFLSFAGISLVPFKRKCTQILYNIYAVIVLASCCYIYTAMELYHMTSLTHDMDILTLNLAFSVTHVSCAVKVTMVLMRKGKIMALLDELKTGILAPNVYRGGSKEITLIKQAIFYASLQLMIFFSNALPILGGRVLYVAVLGKVPVEDHNMELNVTTVTFKRETPYPFLIDFDTRNTPVYVAISTYQVIAYFTHGILMGGIDQIICGCMLHIRSHFLIVSESLDIIFQQCDVKENCYTLKKLHEKDASKIHHRVVECVKYHQAILDFCTKVEGDFKYLMLLQFILSLMIISFGLFQITMNTMDIYALLSMVFYNLLMIEQVLWYCYNGHLVYTASNDISTHIFHLQWVVTNKETKQALLMMMMRSQRPTQFTGGNCVFLNLPSFVTILRASFSYFTVLKQLHAEEEEI